MLIRSRAPLRISFGGGGTDIYPYTVQKGGLVLNATISKFANVTIKSRPDDVVLINSEDYNLQLSDQLGRLSYDGRLDLAKAAIKAVQPLKGLQMLLHTDAPPGSGLGSSSAMTVAIIGALARWLKLAMSPDKAAELAFTWNGRRSGSAGEGKTSMQPPLEA